VLVFCSTIIHSLWRSVPLREDTDVLSTYVTLNTDSLHSVFFWTSILKNFQLYERFVLHLS